MERKRNKFKVCQISKFPWPGLLGSSSSYLHVVPVVVGRSAWRSLGNTRCRRPPRPTKGFPHDPIRAALLFTPLMTMAMPVVSPPFLSYLYGATLNGSFGFTLFVVKPFASASASATDNGVPTEWFLPLDPPASSYSVATVASPGCPSGRAYSLLSYYKPNDSCGLYGTPQSTWVSTKLNLHISCNADDPGAAPVLTSGYLEAACAYGVFLAVGCSDPAALCTLHSFSTTPAPTPTATMSPATLPPTQPPTATSSGTAVAAAAADVAGGAKGGPSGAVAVGAIAGALVGGCALLVLGVLAVVLTLRRQRQQQQQGRGGSGGDGSFSIPHPVVGEEDDVVMLEPPVGLRSLRSGVERQHPRTAAQLPLKGDSGGLDASAPARRVPIGARGGALGLPNEEDGGGDGDCDPQIVCEPPPLEAAAPLPPMLPLQAIVAPSLRRPLPLLLPVHVRGTVSSNDV